MWLLPQFVVMTAAEIMFSITSLQFSYTQVSVYGVVSQTAKRLIFYFEN